MDTIKIDDYTIEVTKEETVINTNRYDINFLIKQKQDIEKQRDDFIAARNKEIEEVETLIAECGKLDIKPKKLAEVK